MRALSSIFAVLLLTVSFSREALFCHGLLSPSSPAKSRWPMNHLPLGRQSIHLPTTRLCMANETKDDRHFLVIPNRNQLISDLLATVIACQLLGLQDVLNSPTFWQDGGWLQPPTLPSTLPILVSRISIDALCWISSSSALNGYQTLQSSSTVVVESCKVAVGFAFLRLLIAFVLGNATLDAVNVVDVLRECYFVSLTIVGARYLALKYL
jgi:hypothetical protein